MASSSSIMSRAFILTLISLAALFAFSEPPLPVLAAQTHWTSSDGVATAALTTDCSAACNVRCGRTRRPNLCRRACRTCCGRCNCVPPGTSGNQNMCPCYAGLTTHGGKRKLPCWNPNGALRGEASTATKMSSSPSKGLPEFFQPAKRFRPNSPPRKSLSTRPCVSTLNDPSIADDASGELKLESSSGTLTEEHRRRIEFNKHLAISKRNTRLCIDRIESAKSEGLDCAKLEELLVEKSWLEALSGELQNPYAKNLFRFVESEMRGTVPIYPPPHLIFNALNATPFDRVKTVILGQDPYHGPSQAMGLAFSVPEGIKPPSSLINIFKELQKDIGCSIPLHGNLERWAVQGVLLLNAVLTVRKHQANSHATKGWEPFTDAVIRAISQKKRGIVFILWGNSAQGKSKLIDATKHHILKAAHPSGLSANRGFFGCRHFSKTNKILERLGVSPIDWQL